MSTELGTIVTEKENDKPTRKYPKQKTFNPNIPQASRKAKLDEERVFVTSTPIARLDKKALKQAANGRPRKFTPTRMRNEINKYFQWCEDNARVPSIKGLMIHLRMHKTQFYTYAEYPEFMDMMEQTRLIIAEWCENEVWHSNGAAAGKIAYMKNIHSWAEKIEEQTTRIVSVEEARAKLEMLLPQLLENLKRQSIEQKLESTIEDAVVVEPEVVNAD